MLHMKSSTKDQVFQFFNLKKRNISYIYIMKDIKV